MWTFLERRLLRGHRTRTAEGSPGHQLARPPWCLPSLHTSQVSHVPNLVLQEVHVPVKQRVGRRQDAHGLHARPTLQFALHGHVGEAGQAEEGPLPEIAAKSETESLCCFGFPFEKQSPRKEITVSRALREKAQPKENTFLEPQGNN